MSEWKEHSLEELGTIVGGATPSTKVTSNYINGTIPWITPKDLSGYTKRYISSGARNITKTAFNNSSLKMLPKHSVLFSSRAPIGYIAIAENEVCTNQGFKSIIPNEKIDYLFLYYLLQYHEKNIENMGSGTTYKEVSGKTMKGIKVTIPTDLKEQKKIAGILDAIDSKIEINNRINDNLVVCYLLAKLCSLVIVQTWIYLVFLKQVLIIIHFVYLLIFHILSHLNKYSKNMFEIIY